MSATTSTSKSSVKHTERRKRKVHNLVFFRLCYLHAVELATNKLGSTSKPEYLIARALARQELECLIEQGTSNKMVDASVNKVQKNLWGWLNYVHHSLRNFVPGRLLPTGGYQGWSPKSVSSKVQVFSDCLLEELCPENKGLLFMGKKALRDFSNEQALLSARLCTAEFVDINEKSKHLLPQAHQLERVKHVNRLLGGKFNYHLENQGKRGVFSINALFKRCCDSSYINQALRKMVAQHCESLFLRLGLISHAGEKYSSSRITKERVRQHEVTKQWKKDTFLIEIGVDDFPETDMNLESDGPDSKKLLSLAECSRTPTQRFAKLYTFVHAIDSIAQQEGLTAGLLTLTMPAEFHPKPMHGPSKWNRSTPKKTNRAISKAWKKVLQRLDRVKIGITGLRVVEPHQDGCPHWHIWMNYKPEYEKRILSAVMSEFPGQLKLRTSSGTLIYNDVLDFEAEVTVDDIDLKASTRLDFAVIDRTISSGATYLMKYLLKTMNVCALNKKELTQDVLDLIEQFDGSKSEGQGKSGYSKNGSLNFEDEPALTQAYFMDQPDLDAANPPTDFRLESYENSQRVDAYRGVWTLRAYDFFGLARCLGSWDQLRQLGTKPTNPHMALLWSYARGGEVEGRIEAGSKIQGKAVEFIRALGCMRAVSFEHSGPYFKLGLLKAPRLDKYGDEAEEVIGLKLFEMKKQHVKAAVTDKETGEIKLRNRLKWVKTEVTQLVTKTKRWTLVRRKKGKDTTAPRCTPNTNVFNDSFDANDGPMDNPSNKSDIRSTTGAEAGAGLAAASATAPAVCEKSKPGSKSMLEKALGNGFITKVLFDKALVAYQRKLTLVPQAAST